VILNTQKPSITTAMNMFKTAAAVFLIAIAGAARAAITESVTREVDVPVPDDALLGAGDTFDFTSAIHGIVPNTTWTGVRVNLEIAGGFNGDLYVYLEHGTDFAVLLNRPGRSTGLDSGYGDSGFNISLDDTAPNGDVHLYRSRVNPGGGILTGRWQPDGRDVIPEDALDTDPRSALLSTFLTGTPNGEWSLTIVDVGPGDQARFVRWGLDFEFSTPPEIVVHEGVGTSGAAITSGQASAVDFGVTAVGLPVARDFTVVNDGHEGLVVTAVTAPSGFVLVDVPKVPFTVIPGGSRSFSAILSAQAGGVASGDVTITCNDADEGTFRIPVTGTVDGNAPTISKCAEPQALVLANAAGVALPDLTGGIIATDVEPGPLTVTQSPEAGTLLLAGTTLVTITVRDGAGNEAFCETAVTVVRIPSAGADFGETVSGVPTTFRGSRLLANDTDPDGEALTLVGVASTSANGGSISRVGDAVTYTPPGGFVGTDTFSYTLAAGSKTATGWVTVRVRTSDLIPSNAVYLRPVASPGTGMEMRFSGIGGRAYSVQFTETIGSGWTELSRQTAQAGSGFIDFVHTTPPPGSGFYRCLPAN
jgi:hypothetical protein